MTMSHNKKISVIIPNFNYAHFLDEAIESVLRQTYQNIELIIVNNGSTDDSLIVLEKYRGRVHVIDQQNLGQSGARNSGLKYASGELIAFLDADDFWVPNKLELQIQSINEATQLVYCGISQFKNLENQARRTIHPKFKGNCVDYFIDLPGASIVLSGESTALFTRELLNKTGNFDMELNSTAGWDFFRRCSIFTEFDFVDEPLTHYRIHSSNMSSSHQKVIEDMRRAYSKMFSDSNMEINPQRQVQTKIKLEWSFLKTYLRIRKLKLVASSGLNLLKMAPSLFDSVFKFSGSGKPR